MKIIDCYKNKDELSIIM